MKPKIYGYCKAGCQWEAVLKEDFDRIASVIKQQPDADGTYKLNPLNAYKVHTTKGNGNYYKAQFWLMGNGVSHPIEYDEFDEYRDYIIFEILSLSTDITGNYLTIVYEVNGNRYTETKNDDWGQWQDLHLEINNATEVYSFNNNAEIITGVQQIYETAVDAEGDTAPEELNIDDTYPTRASKTYEGQRKAEVGDLIIFKCDVPNSKGQTDFLGKITAVTDNDDEPMVDFKPICFLQSERTDDVVTYIQLNTEIKELEKTNSGIYVHLGDAEIEFNDGERHQYTDVEMLLPIVAGEGVDFEIDETHKAIKVSASGGGGLTLNKYTFTMNSASFSAANRSKIYRIFEQAKGNLTASMKGPSGHFAPLNGHIDNNGYLTLCTIDHYFYATGNEHTTYIMNSKINSSGSESNILRTHIMNDGSIEYATASYLKNSTVTVTYWNDVEIV